MHGLLDVVVDGHFEAVEALDDYIESIEDDLFDGNAVQRDFQRRTYQMRTDLVHLRRVALPMREVVNAIQHHRVDVKSARELDPHYDDLYDHVLRVSEWTESLRDMISTVFETNLSLQDARLNTVMKKLTGWAAIIAVPTAITGFYGQNVPYPASAHGRGSSSAPPRSSCSSRSCMWRSSATTGCDVRARRSSSSNCCTGRRPKP